MWCDSSTNWFNCAMCILVLLKPSHSPEYLCFLDNTVLACEHTILTTHALVWMHNLNNCPMNILFSILYHMYCPLPCPTVTSSHIGQEIPTPARYEVEMMQH
ncbi:hypothetical protein HELRODRAFT_171591 [Helobdella robusta]|uniref:Uncharacterized protein n=1 Tax=Helobdella robusta TaxID=6412 RepID=T1F4F7_HELRO|nr:hypothetical protein HELRODRAFT_171591 [Helobdella robusta]ESO05235.1 hypothetical protein HELRODRAFT_171591 [Helobdella robusta]